ncbi:MAG: ribonuclease HI [bacterium]
MQDYIIYTDGCSLGNPGPGGYGAVIIADGKFTELSGGFRLTTNNRMEILAAVTALKSVPANSNVVLNSDSKLLTDAINQRWLPSWEKKGWKKADNKPVLNKDLWLELIPLLKTRKVKFVWVKGHAGIEHNERCDIICKSAAENPGNNIDQFYEDSKEDNNLFTTAPNQPISKNQTTKDISSRVSLTLSKDKELLIRLQQNGQTIEFGKETLLEIYKITKDFDYEN